MAKNRDKLLVEIGSRIRACRTAKGRSQKELGDQLGLSDYRQISVLETGRRDFRLASLERIAEALRVSLAELMPGVEEVEDKELSAVVARLTKCPASTRVKAVKILRTLLEP